MMRLFLFFTVFCAAVTEAAGPRARTLGVPFDGQTGPLNAITDVAGVEVGHSTIIRGEGDLKVGEGPVRTGITAIFPRGKARFEEPVFAGWFSLNGNGEMTGTTWIEESGQLEGPIAITNTHSVGLARDAMIKWQLQRKPRDPNQPWWFLPVVAETWDGFLNDINGFHVKESHVFEALDSAKGGAVAEGNVGGGTGMVCFQFKGGIGTSSRVVTAANAKYTVGVLVQANFGRRPQLLIAGVPVGREITEAIPKASLDEQEAGSIIIVIATDAPLLPHQLERLARRASLGIARTGGVAMNGSGDIFLAFSTANPATATAPVPVTMLPNDFMNPLFEATVQATEEAIINAMVAAETMVGINGRRVIALPHDRLVEVLRKYNRLSPR